MHIEEECWEVVFFTCVPVLSSEQACEGVLLADCRYVTAFINHHFTSAGPDLSHKGRGIPDVSWLCVVGGGVAFTVRQAVLMRCCATDSKCSRQ